MKKNTVCAVAIGSTMDELIHQIKLAQKEADIVEVRMDHIRDIKNINLQIIKKIIDKDLIITCRRCDEGGKWSGSEDARLDILKTAFHLEFSFIDVELRTLEEGVFRIPSPRKTKVIISHHNFSETPSYINLKAISKRMELFHPDIKKIATFVNSEEDTKILIKFLLEKCMNEIVCIIGMGELGKKTRIISPLLGGSFTYCSISNGRSSAPGQLTCGEMQKIYTLLE